MAFLDDLVTKLEADGVGTRGVNIFTTSGVTVPKKTGATLHIKKTGGTAPEHTQNATLRPAFLLPGAQIVAAADDYDDADTFASSAYYSLGQVRNEFINSGWYRRIRCLQEPHDLGVNDREQQQSGFNILAEYNRRDV
jgi:hypothetical protein